MSLVILFAAILGANLLTVCPQGCRYGSIQEGIRAASEGDTVLVKKGAYRQEKTLTIDRPLNLIGEDRPELIGGEQSDIISVTARNVAIEGFKIVSNGSSFLHEIAGVKVDGVSSCAVHNNEIFSRAYGVYLANSSDCRIEGNFIQGTYISESESGNAVHSWSGSGHKILSNTISGHRDGIYLEFTNDSEVRDNSVTKNIRYGLHFMSSHRNLYSQNRFTNNGAGVAVMYSQNIKMIENEFADNHGAASYGLLLKDIGAGEIIGNLFKNNTYGIYMEGTNRSGFSENEFSGNGYGLRILGDCSDNRFTHNNFFENTFDVTTNSSRNPNLFCENYWTHYDGYDFDHDGRGDIPFRLSSLSSVIVERFDSAYLLIKSPLFVLLDSVEQALPMLTPESLSDGSPLMLPWKARQAAPNILGRDLSR